MLNVKVIATYLLSKKIVTNHALGKWLFDIKYSEKRFGSAVFPGDWFIQRIHSLHRKQIISPKTASFLLQISLWKDEAISFYNNLIKQGITIVTEGDGVYPELLKAIPDRPAILFMRGDASIAAHKNAITLVGTRDVSLWGAMKARQLSFEAAKLGVVTISGFARGVDTIVLEETLRSGGQSIAVLPELKLSCPIIKNKLEIAEYLSSDTPVSKWQFVARNRIAAGLSQKTVVIEAPIRSGTLITAQLAVDYNRDLYTVLPNPTDYNSYGGIAFSQGADIPKYINSLYDIYFIEENEIMIRKFYNVISGLTKKKINVPENEYRHLAHVDLKRYIFAAVNRNLEQFDQCMVELLRNGIVLERKGVVLFNFSGYRANGKELSYC